HLRQRVAFLDVVNRGAHTPGPAGGGIDNAGNATLDATSTVQRKVDPGVIGGRVGLDSNFDGPGHNAGTSGEIGGSGLERGTSIASRNAHPGGVCNSAGATLQRA